MNAIADLLNPNVDQGNLRAAFGAGGFVLGTVADNGDKQNAGMVKVEFTAWKDGRNICEWMPLLRPYAGKDYGSYLVPEIGDTVLVGFIGQDMQRPFVFGSLFPDDAMGRDSFHEKNNRRRLKTKGGIDLVLTDEAKKAAISATTPGGLRCTVEDENGKITLSDKNNKNHLVLDTKKKEILLEVDTKITVKCGKCELAMNGKSGAMTIQCDSLDVSATRQVAVSGGKVEASAREVAIDGKITTTIKGGIVKIN